MLWFERMAKNIVKIPKDAYQYAIDYAQKLFEYRDMETLKKNFQGGNVLITDPYTGKTKYVLIRLNEVISGNVGMEVNVLDDKRYLLNISAKAIENRYKILQEKNWSPASLQSALREWQGHFVHEFIHIIDPTIKHEKVPGSRGKISTTKEEFNAYFCSKEEFNAYSGSLVYKLQAWLENMKSKDPQKFALSLKEIEDWIRFPDYPLPKNYFGFLVTHYAPFLECVKKYKKTFKQRIYTMLLEVKGPKKEPLKFPIPYNEKKYKEMRKDTTFVLRPEDPHVSEKPSYHEKWK